MPRSCITNSRYFTAQRFEDIVSALGYEKIRDKLTQKLTYTLWRRTVESGRRGNAANFPKKEVNPGKTRNNFVITLGGNAVP